MPRSVPGLQVSVGRPSVNELRNGVKVCGNEWKSDERRCANGAPIAKATMKLANGDKNGDVGVKQASDADLRKGVLGDAPSVEAEARQGIAVVKGVVAKGLGNVPIVEGVARRSNLKGAKAGSHKAVFAEGADTKGENEEYPNDEIAVRRSAGCNDVGRIVDVSLDGTGDPAEPGLAIAVVRPEEGVISVLGTIEVDEEMATAETEGMTDGSDRIDAVTRV